MRTVRYADPPRPAGTMIKAPASPQAAGQPPVAGWLKNRMAGLTVDPTERADPPYEVADRDASRPKRRLFDTPGNA